MSPSPWPAARRAFDRPVPRLLLAAARGGDLDPACLEPGTDWGEVLASARVHGLLPRLHERLGTAAGVPEAAAEALRQHFQANLRANLARTAELLLVLERLDQENIRALPFKGPTLAAVAHDNVGLREFVDLDVLVAQADFARARAVLGEAGYRVGGGLSPGQQAAYASSVGQLSLVREGGPCPLELHARLTPRAYPFGLALEELWPRRRAVVVAGRKTVTLGAEDLLLVLCVHGAKEHWRRLAWVLDVAGLLGREAALDWPRLEEQARRLNCRRILGLGLGLAHHLLGAPVPEEVLRRYEADPALAGLAGAACRTLATGDGRSPRGLASARFHGCSRERWRDGASYVASLVFEPTVADWQAVPLPDALLGLHYLVRPLRLAWRRLRSASGGTVLWGGLVPALALGACVAAGHFPRHGPGQRCGPSISSTPSGQVWRGR